MNIDDLPDDLLVEILAKLPATAVAACECVSTRFLAASRKVPLRVHVGPGKEREIRRWAAERSRADRVVKVSSRRVPFPIDGFDNLVWMDAMYTRMTFPDAVGSRLRFLRLSRVVRQFGTTDVFRIENLPPTLTHAYLSFDDSFRCVEIADPGNVTALEVRAPYNFLGRPNIRVLDLGKIEDLALNTSGSVIMRVGHVGLAAATKRVRIEAMDTVDVAETLAPFRGSDVVIGSFPRAVVTLSEFSGLLDPQVLAIEAALVVVDATAARLRYLEIRADRLAATTGAVPDRVRVTADVGGESVPREFFS